MAPTAYDSLRVDRSSFTNAVVRSDGPLRFGAVVPASQPDVDIQLVSDDEDDDGHRVLHEK